MSIFRRALAFFRPDGTLLALAFGLLLLGAVAGLFKPWPLAVLVDSVLGTKPVPERLATWAGGSKSSQVLGLAGALFAVYFAQASLAALQNYLTIQIGLRGLARVRGELFATLQRLSLRYHQGQQTGDLLYRATWDVYSFQTLFQQGLVVSCGAALSLALMLVVMFQVNWRLTLAAVTVVPLLLLAIRVLGRPMNAKGAAAQTAEGVVAATLQQTLAALPLIQSFTREPVQQAGFAEQAEASRAARLGQHGWELLYGWGVAAAFAAGTAGIVWLGSREILAGRLTTGELLVFLAYLTQLYEPLNQLSHAGATVATATAGAQRVLEILDTREQVKDGPVARGLKGRELRMEEGGSKGEAAALEVRGRIAFERVTFGYVKSAPVLRDVRLDIPAGQRIAILGPSGGGKTSLLHLIPRFFDPDDGIVRLDGVSLRELRLRDLRQQVALAMQESILLPGTIAENIAFGKPKATPEEIEAAARAAGAHAFIRNLPGNYRAVVGEGAARLSVGERQRLGLARALIKNAPILLLDEPTSALDAGSEQQVLAGLQEHVRGKTVVLITHRAEALQLAERVVLLADGEIAELGTPQEAFAVWRERYGGRK